jgi:hypothetical protein
MITKDVTRIKQAVEVIEGQLSGVSEILQHDEKLELPMNLQLVQQSMTIIVMAVQSLTK